jgi:hypothetical protein
MPLVWQPSQPDQPEPEPVGEDEAVFRNVCGYLVDLKFTDLAAEALANGHADWHEARSLLEHGCSHELVVAILL